MPQDKKSYSLGFTLLELLIVMGILTVVLAIILIALNPYEQLARTSDVTAKVVTQDFITAAQQYFTTEKAMPWENNTNCKNEFASGKTLAQVPDCTQALTGGGKLQSSYIAQSQLQDIYLTICGNSAVLCYNPRSKIENQSEETHYDKYGVNDPGCPSATNTSTSCYWCRPLNNDTKCTPPPTPTSTTPPTPTPTPDPATIYSIGGYKLDDPKFLQTYAVVTFPYPGFPAYTTQPDQDGGVDSGWMIDVSFRPDFGGTTTVDGFGYYVNGVPATSNAETDLWAAYAGNGAFGSLTSPSYAAERSLTTKYTAFLSMPFEWSTYVNSCGKPIYWRVANFRTGISGVNYDSNKFSPTYTNTVDCTTKVGIINLSLWWTNPPSDFNHDGIVDYTDYIIGSLWTKFRSGGWYPPE